MSLNHLILTIFAATSATAATTLVTTDFDGSTGHHVFSGNTDNVAGSSSLGVSWTTDASVTTISGLTAISTTSGGFAVTQNGSGVYANADSVYLSRNLNLDTDPQRGFSFDFTTDSAWTLDSLTIVSEHTNNVGDQNQVYTSDLNYSLTGAATLSGSTNIDYGLAGAWQTTTFTDNAGASLAAGNYTLSIWMANLSSGGAYAV